MIQLSIYMCIANSFFQFFFTIGYYKILIIVPWWVLKSWCFWIVVLEKTLESPLDSKEIQPVNPEGNHLWIFIGRADAEAPIIWSSDTKSQLIRKDPDAGQDWRWKEKRMTGWDGCEFEQVLWVGDGQGSLVCLQSVGLQRVGHNWATELNW